MRIAKGQLQRVCPFIIGPFIIDRCGKLIEKYRPCGGVRCSRLTCGNAIDSREGKLEIVVPREIKRHTMQINLA